MELQVNVHPLAKQDLGLASEYYESKQKGLAMRFVSMIEQITELIALFPQLYPRFESKSYRKAVVPKFPFIVIYEIKNEQIWIIAIFNTSQSPSSLDERFSQL